MGSLASRLGGALIVSMPLLMSFATNASEPIRVGVLRFGTVNWELNVMQHHGFLKEQGVALEVVLLGSKRATNIALQGGAADIIVDDWLWVSRQRNSGKNYTFVPYSSALGALMVHPSAGVRNIEDLRSKKLGIAGGPVDKSWLLLRAYTAKEFNQDIDAWVETQFGAPPLLNQLIGNERIPAVLTFWHYAARLEAGGMETLFEVESLLSSLGLKAIPPLLGWVFDARWAREHPSAIRGFLQASYAAKKRLADADEEWERIRDLTKAPNDETLSTLRDAYRAGIPRHFTEHERQGATKLMTLLAKAGGKKLVGEKPRLAPGTFWPEFDIDGFWKSPD